MKNGQKLKLGDVPGTPPRNIQEVQASKLGDAQGITSSSIKSTRSFFNALYFYCFMPLCVILGASLFSVVCLLFSIKLDPIIFILECDTLRYTASCLLWSEIRSAILHHVYFGVRHAPPVLHKNTLVFIVIVL